MYAQVKKNFFWPIYASGDITYISVFSSEKIWEIFIFLLICMDKFFKEISKFSAKENWKSFLAIKKLSRNVVPRIHHYLQVI
jgi:hypothetical protein